MGSAGTAGDAVGNQSTAVQESLRRASFDGTPIIPLVLGENFDALTRLQLGHLQAIFDFYPTNRTHSTRLLDALRYFARGDSSGLKLPTEPHDVYFSYSHRDSVTVNRIYKDLTADGIDVFLDVSHILPGTEWEKAIEDAIDNAKAVVAMRSPSAVTSVYVARDIELAQVSSKPIVPVVLSGDPSSVLGIQLATSRWI